MFSLILSINNGTIFSYLTPKYPLARPATISGKTDCISCATTPTSFPLYVDCLSFHTNVLLPGNACSVSNLTSVEESALTHRLSSSVSDDELLPNMIEASGERRASEAKRIALVSDYSKKTVTFLGGALLKKMLG